MNEVWYEKMKDFYDKLEGMLKDKVKDCQACDKCCTFASVPYREIELDFIFEHLFRIKRDDLFEELCGQGANWARTGKSCMFHKREGKNCIIYTARPYNCRVFGPYADEKVGLPPQCVYETSAVRVPRDKVLEMLPLYKEYHQLASNYQKFMTAKEPQGESEKAAK
jgi:Fe-S-cluster containining protein